MPKEASYLGIDHLFAVIETISEIPFIQSTLSSGYFVPQDKGSLDSSITSLRLLFLKINYSVLAKSNSNNRCEELRVDLKLTAYVQS